jgi:SAM-dependent methyltransferase
VPFARVQADFDALPFALGQFDLVIFNGSLHYAPDVWSTLEHATSMLAPGGRIVVIDSPMFERDRHGAAMRARLVERLCREYAIVEPVEPGEGFLTFARLDRWAARRGLSSRFLPTHDGWRRRLQRAAAGLGRSVPPARFGLWVAA